VINTLVIDASTYRGTVAIFRDRTLASRGDAVMRGADREALMPAVIEALGSAGMGVGDLSRVVCGEGPGSFTSLRIAASIAKGIALGRGIPLFAVSSLALAAAASGESGKFVVTIDALRDEWYVAGFERATPETLVQRSPTTLVPRVELESFPALYGPVIVASPDAASCAIFFEEIERRGPVDLDRWEPSYGRLAEAQVKWEAAHGRPLRA
jgi:tRNA threonylcarbamoyladenosine biosynthesis protein TsaB